MERTVKHFELLPVPHANVLYEPEYQVLYIQNGLASEVSEEMAKGVLILYDKDVDDQPTSAVAIRIDRAETVLRPFVEAILDKYGINPAEMAPDVNARAADD